ncbi:MAG: hypothetical protein ACYDH5_04740 [Acidimicrobiales bacterium]
MDYEVLSATPVMSHRTVTLFNGYLSKMQAGHAEIVPAVQAVAASYGHPASTSQAIALLRSTPSLSKTYQLMGSFPAMYASFHTMVATMGTDVPDFLAVRALPPFTWFPHFFILPSLAAVALGLLLLRPTVAGVAGGAGGAEPTGPVPEEPGEAAQGSGSAEAPERQEPGRQDGPLPVLAGAAAAPTPQLERTRVTRPEVRPRRLLPRAKKAKARP